ncbi:ATP-grasp fold amidoligase family protein [Ornithinimicrobium sediminis]|uniref:ATP-grasp fold amidoligase family protein n=1 Tax=Ornithinimicrobium sediminis TaxID=2904603 RepID=UPI002FCDA58D
MRGLLRRGASRCGLMGAYRRLLKTLPPSSQRRWLYLRHHRRPLRLQHPVRFTEKVNWRMVYDRREVISLACDKLSSKEYAVAHGVRVPQTLWVGTDVAEFASSWTPEMCSEWVLKPNFSSGHIVFGSGRPDAEALAGTVGHWMGEKSRATIGEWGYGSARRVIFAEERLSPPDVPIQDYKFFVFQGRVLFCRTVHATVKPRRTRWYGEGWVPLDYRDGGYELADPVPMPDTYADMEAAAQRLGAAYDFVRVDLYDMDGQVVFGELTVYHTGGLQRLDRHLDLELGHAWSLPSVRAGSPRPRRGRRRRGPR